MTFSEEYPHIFQKCSEAQTIQEILHILRDHSDEIEDKYNFGFEKKEEQNHA